MALPSCLKLQSSSALSGTGKNRVIVGNFDGNFSRRGNTGSDLKLSPATVVAGR